MILTRKKNCFFDDLKKGRPVFFLGTTKLTDVTLKFAARQERKCAIPSHPRTRHQDSQHGKSNVGERFCGRENKKTAAMTLATRRVPDGTSRCISLSLLIFSLFSTVSLLNNLSFSLLIFLSSQLSLFSMTMTMITGSVRSLCPEDQSAWTLALSLFGEKSLDTTVQVNLCRTRAT